ncbi:MAG: GTPase HflX [Bacteroidetes bacterium]|nr:MAG: GTPase HflX [Bacteroidota bacterium]
MIELRSTGRERAIAVAVAPKSVERRQTEDHLAELVMLADTAGADVVHTVLQSKDRFDAAYYIGKGKVEQLTQLAEEEQISLIIFDDDLSPAQVRNLEKMTNRKIVDRSGLILDIFASRARTNEAKTQVELAQLQYMLPRLTRLWTHLSKQFGGVGTRGPGETQIETDRRMIRERIAHLKERLERIATQRATQRKGRKEQHNIALVGYTNAGKSTLLNTLSDSDVFVEDRLFATLDATTRTVELGTTETVLVTDTVGFIRKLPHHLVASFKSTLEEVTEADVLLHVIDLSHPQMEEHIAVVTETIAELGAAQTPVIHVFNKVDALEDRTLVMQLQERYQPSVFISARRGINILGLKELLLSHLRSSFTEYTVTLPPDQYRILSKLHDLAEVTEQAFEEHGTTVTLRVDAKSREYVERLLRSIKVL